MNMLNCADYDFNGNNQYDLKELDYTGKLYHYTNEQGLKGIFSPKNSKEEDIPLQSDCISLRLTRIADMTRNDREERRHIIAAIQDAISNLEKEPESSEKYVTPEFVEIVQKFLTSNIDKDQDFYTIISDEVNQKFGNYQVKWGYGKLDYYVACFSTNPDNEYIMEKSGLPVRLAFKKLFSSSDEIPKCFFPPYSKVAKCFLDYYLKKVLYCDVEKRRLIESYLLYIYKHNNGTEDITNQLQDMCSLYDAFFKKCRNSETKYEYWKEEEVRFVIRVPHEPSSYSLLAEQGIVFDSEVNEDGEIRYKYLYLPISKEFLFGGNTES